MAISPGVSRLVTQSNAVLPGSFIESLTLNPPSPVEIGRLVSGGVQGKAADGSSIGTTN